MTDTYNDSTGSRKKFLIPLVVLLLCAVSLTGAGYAYNATVSVDDNSSDVDFLAIDLYKTDGTTPIEKKLALNDAGIVVTTATVIGADDKTISATVEKARDFIYVFAFKVKSENSTMFTVNDTSTVTITADASGVADLSPAVTTVHALAITTADFAVFDNAACTGTALDGNLTVGETYYVPVSIATIVGEYSYTGDEYSAFKLADDLVSAITLTFSILIDVEAVVA